MKWIDVVFSIVDVFDGKAIVLDSCRAHISNKVKEHCRRRNIELIVIPGGLTPLRAGDIGIFKVLKIKFLQVLIYGRTRIMWSTLQEVFQSHHGRMLYIHGLLMLREVLMYRTFPVPFRAMAFLLLLKIGISLSMIFTVACLKMRINHRGCYCSKCSRVGTNTPR